MPEGTPGRQEQIREIMAGIERGIQELFQSGKLEAYLKTMSKFHRYSLNNTMLIFMQCPTATYCAGYQTWKNDFGRHVKRGEKGIRILAPAPFKKTVQVKKVDPVTNAPIRDGCGQIVTEEQTIVIPRYKTVTIFDVAQTDGPPLPQLSAELTGDVRQYEAFMEALRRVSPVPMEIRPVERDADGFFSRETQSITIREDMSQIRTVCASIHEIIHALRHNSEQAEGRSKAEKEVEAEAAAMAVCAYYSLDTAADSIPYLASYSSDKSLPELRSSLQTIMDTTNRLITDIDRSFAEVCRERGIAVPDRLDTEAKNQKPPQTRNRQRGVYPLPDTAVPADALAAVGYRMDDLLPLSASRACELLERDMTVYMVQTGENPAMAFDRDDILDQPEGTVFAVPREEWEASAEFHQTIESKAGRSSRRTGRTPPAGRKSAGKER